MVEAPSSGAAPSLAAASFQGLCPACGARTLFSGLARFAPELQNPRRLVLRYRRSEAKVSDILAAAGAAGLEIADLTTEEADLEDIFLQLTREPPAAPAGDRRAAGR